MFRGENVQCGYSYLLGKDDVAMIKQGFSLGNRDWWIMCYYGVRKDNLQEAYETLVASGCPDYRAQRACMNLSLKNAGYTFTNFTEHTTVMLMSDTTSPEQMYDSIQHESRHAADNIGEYYGLEARGEESAYLQGEIARLMFPAAAMVICPKCNHESEY